MGLSIHPLSFCILVGSPSPYICNEPTSAIEPAFGCVPQCYTVFFYAWMHYILAHLGVRRTIWQRCNSDNSNNQLPHQRLRTLLSDEPHPNPQTLYMRPRESTQVLHYSSSLIGACAMHFGRTQATTNPSKNVGP